MYKVPRVPWHCPPNFLARYKCHRQLCGDRHSPHAARRRAGEGQKPSRPHLWVEIENHRNGKLICLTAISSHTASKFYSPVVFALRTHPLRRGGNVTRIARGIYSRQQRRISVSNKTAVNFL